MYFLSEAKAIEDDIVELRHRLHRHPELGTELPWTREQVLKELTGIDLEITLPEGDSSIFAVLRGGAADPDLSRRPVVLLRADMDALPLNEMVESDFKSEIDGLMHACGHDLHTAILVGAVKLLDARRAELKGDIVFLFQTAEESLTGARNAIAAGVLDVAGKRVDRAYGAHVFSGMMPHSTFQTRKGPIMAAADGLFFDIVGKGGHGSMPEKGADPVAAMAEIISGLQVLVTRRFTAFRPVVVNVGVAQAGDASNIIPESCHVEASIRTSTPEDRALAEEVFTTYVTKVAEAHRCEARINYLHGVAPAVCDDDAAEFALEVLTDMFGAERVPEMQLPLSGSEDFAEIMAEVPGAFICYSGTPRGEDYTQWGSNHSATCWFDDVVIPEAVAMYAELGFRQCDELAGTL